MMLRNVSKLLSSSTTLPASSPLTLSSVQRSVGQRSTATRFARSISGNNSSIIDIIESSDRRRRQIALQHARLASSSSSSSSSSSFHLSVVANCQLSHGIRRRSFVSHTIPTFEKVKMKVPTMGDSITEGTIVEWTVQVGQKVQEEDVIALIETDKVTVEIKANTTGVVTQQYGAVDDTVEVGADLCEIDTEAAATVEGTAASSLSSESSAAAPTPAPSPPAKAPAPPVAASAHSSISSDSSSHRVPSIKFLGKDGWAKLRSGEDPSKPAVVYVPFNYGRLKFSEEEMESLIMGGANLAPDVKQYSTGASFTAY